MRRSALVALPLAFLGYFFAYPLVRILWRGLSAAGAESPSHSDSRPVEGFTRQEIQ